LYERLDFKSWLRELQQESQAGGGTDALSAGSAQAGSSLVQADYQAILTPEQLDEWMMRIAAAQLVSLDTETTGLDPMRAELVGISFSVEPHQGGYVPLGHRYAGAPSQLSLDFVLEKLKPWLTDATAPKLGQNLKFDRHVFANYGIGLKGIVHDTLLQSYVFESHRPHDMDNLALRHLGIKTISYDEVTGKGAARISFEQVDIERAAQYAAEDADITLQLHQHLYAEVGKDAKLDHIYRTLEMPVMDVLFEMERNGVLLDLKLLETQSR
jgi:DNA polymerase-1